VVDSATGAVNYFGNYYYMTHFSRYMRPGAVRIGSSYTGADLELCAFKNLDNSIVVAILKQIEQCSQFQDQTGHADCKAHDPGARDDGFYLLLIRIMQ